MEERMPEYLHMPTQILWFDSSEFSMIIVLYLMAMVFGGLTWIALFIGPCIIIPYKRKKERGYFQHLLYKTGFASLKGYPLPTANVFHE